MLCYSKNGIGGNRPPVGVITSFAHENGKARLEIDNGSDSENSDYGDLFGGDSDYWDLEIYKSL